MDTEQIKQRIEQATGAVDVRVASDGACFHLDFVLSDGEQVIRRKLEDAEFQVQWTHRLDGSQWQAFVMDTRPAPDAPTFEVGQQVVASRDITEAMLYSGEDKPGSPVVVLQGVGGKVTQLFLQMPSMKYRVHFLSGDAVRCKADWLTPQPQSGDMPAPDVADADAFTARTPLARLVSLLAEVAPDHPVEHWDIMTQCDLADALIEMQQIVDTALYGKPWQDTRREKLNLGRDRDAALTETQRGLLASALSHRDLVGFSYPPTDDRVGYFHYSAYSNSFSACRELADLGLLERHPANGWAFRITDAGASALARP